MKISEFLEHWQKFADDHPGVGDVDIVLAQSSGFRTDKKDYDYAELLGIEFEPAHVIESIVEEKKEDRILFVVGEFESYH